LSPSPQKYGFGIRDPRSGIRKKPIPDPGVKKASDPGPGSATLPIKMSEVKIHFTSIFLIPQFTNVNAPI
jgi:hypothetical protein